MDAASGEHRFVGEAIRVPRDRDQEDVKRLGESLVGQPVDLLGSRTGARKNSENGVRASRAASAAFRWQALADGGSRRRGRRATAEAL